MNNQASGSGPALKQKMSHRAIHDAAQAHAKGITAEVIQLFHANEKEECFKAAKGLVAHWEEKVVAHADAEDEGLYQELLNGEEVADKGLYMLMRDHDLFRKIAAQIKEKLESQGEVTQENIYEFTTLIILNDFHHQGEEETLFPGQ
ncbi:MAG TPA: hemerythrin domain-containing protein [Pseudogracilibacillus sp.]|nr:hemerythrin domain-containing protein [Pseudogracilibacillus sp.]